MDFWTFDPVLIKITYNADRQWRESTERAQTASNRLLNISYEDVLPVSREHCRTGILR